MKICYLDGILLDAFLTKTKLSREKMLHYRLSIVCENGYTAKPVIVAESADKAIAKARTFKLPTPIKNIFVERAYIPRKDWVSS